MSKPISERVKDTANLLETVVRDLDNIAKELQATQPKRIITVESVKGLFTYELLGFLRIEEAANDIVVIFKEDVPEVTFADIADRVKRAGGEYFKKTEDTARHFKISK